MPRGRPSVYTSAIADEICERLPEETLQAICRDDHIPAIGTVLGWVTDDREGFAERYARARSLQIERMSHEIIAIADDSSQDVIERTDEKGNVYELKDQDHINRSRLRVDTRKWLLARLLPKKYGDATLMKMADADGKKLQWGGVTEVRGTDE